MRPASTATAALATAALLPALAPTVADAAPAQPSWLGTTSWTTYADQATVGGRPTAVAYAPDGATAYEVRATADGARLVVLRQSATTGELTRVPGLPGCFSFPVSSGCTALPATPSAITDVVVDPDGGAVRLVGQGVMTLQRDRATGALTVPVPGAHGCLPSAGAAVCGAAGEPLRLRLAGGGRALALSPTRLLSLTVDPADRGLTPVAGPAGCLSAGPSEGCTPARGTGWSDDLAIGPDGRDAYAVGARTGTLTVLRARIGADGALTQPGGAAGLPLERPGTCAVGADDPCVPVTAILPRDGGHLYLTSPRAEDASRDTDRGDVLTRSATGDLTPAPCTTAAACPTLHGPATASVDGRQIYSTYRRTVSEAPRDGQFIQTWARDADSGRLTGRGSGTLLAIADGDAPYTQLVAGPTGRWLLTNSLEVLRRADTKPPTVTVRGIPGRCARGPVTVRITVTGARDPRRKVQASAYEEIGYDRGPDVAARSAKAARLTLRIPRRRGTELTLAVDVPGRLRNDVRVERAVRFC